ncbi:MAG: PilZ domain-containing protein [Oleiphilaceae bacterium]|nr:PilZ domain-containing protein [Oleiphilaceae bacterium]
MNGEDYSFGHDDGSLSGADQRREFRLAGRARLTLELEAVDPEDPDAGAGKHLTCHTHDLSVNGIRLLTREPLSKGALLPMVVSLADNENSFKLTGEVVWCESRGDAGWAVGLKVLFSDQTSYIDWVEAVGRAMIQD